MLEEANMNRSPVVAGQFYPGSARTLSGQVAGYLGSATGKSAKQTLLAMVPHAGYVYSGGVCGKTLGAANLADVILMLGPNHTGRGKRLAVWPDGVWSVPGCEAPVDAETAAALIKAEPRLVADPEAHLGEHSLEVILPFLCAINPKTRIIPVCVSEHDPAVLAAVGASIARTLKELETPVSLVVSSDMSHYINHEAAKKLDALALERVLALDPDGLHQTVRERGISMCGVLPMTLGLHIALSLGASSAEITAYATSGETSGDYGQVVGYAGALVS